jgi:predicted enzyme related to lactoylglutathione lyase
MRLRGYRYYEVARIFVEPDFQNQGIGTRTFEFLWSEYPEVERWTLGTPAWNRRTRHFYRKVGFTGTGDAQRAALFYETLFGWQVVHKETADGSDYWIFDTGDEPRAENLGRGALWLRPDDADHRVVVYVVVEDIDAVLGEVADLGGAVTAPKTPQGSAFKAYVADPDGNVLGLWQERHRA